MSQRPCASCGSTDRLRYFEDVNTTILGSKHKPLVMVISLCFGCDENMLCAGSRPRTLRGRILAYFGVRPLRKWPRR